MRAIIHHIMMVILFSIAGVSAVTADEDSDNTDTNVRPAELSEAEALEVWGRVHEVFSHPRCANCHVPDDNRPRWSGPSYEKRYPAQDTEPYHAMNVNGGDSRRGEETMRCSTCHQSENSRLPHGPPGSPVWELAPLEMQWWDKTSQEICEQIKDPARNGNRTLAEVADHVDHDALVLWGWEPGPGREKPPYSAPEVAEFILQWADAGAPCPSS